jgi:hypothetical protein
MAYLRKCVFPFDSRLPSWLPPSHLSVKWTRAVSFVFFPHRSTVATSSRRLRPPCVARPRDASPPPPLISLLNPSSSRPAINGVKAITAGRFPSPAPVCPSLATIKGRGAPPDHHHTHLALNRVLLSPQRPLHRAPPPSIIPHHRPVVSDPLSPSLVAGEAHLRPLFIFSQPR